MRLRVLIGALCALAALICTAAAADPDRAAARQALSSRSSFWAKPKSLKSFPLVFHDPQEASQKRSARILQEAPIFAALTDALSESLIMPAQVTVEFGSCGVENAFYDPAQKMIVLCYELADQFRRTLKAADKKAREPELDQAVAGAMSFIFLHELGHALIDVLDLPVVGREEDAADQLAAVLLIEMGDEGVASVSVAVSEFAAGAERITDLSELDFADVHSLEAQRAHNLLCLIYGSSPKGYAQLIEEAGLTKERAEVCPEEYARIRKAWDVLLAPHQKEEAQADADDEEGEEDVDPQADEEESEDDEEEAEDDDTEGGSDDQESGDETDDSADAPGSTGKKNSVWDDDGED